MKVGPGKYDPEYKLIKKAAPSYNWFSSQTKRTEANTNLPG